jgi:hypothetical protein
MAKGWLLNRKRAGEVGIAPDSKRVRIDHSQERSDGRGSGGGMGGTRVVTASRGKGGPLPGPSSGPSC